MITSKQNPKVQWARALIQHRQEREKFDTFVVEGVRLVEEVHHANLIPLMLFYCNGLSQRGIHLVDQFKSKKVDTIEVNPDVMCSISDTETPQGIIAILSKTAIPLPASLNFILIADGISDPGNLGTILRTASAASAQAVILTKGTTDPFAPKVLRAGMGAHFHLPIHIMDWEMIHDLVKSYQEIPLKLYLAVNDGGRNYWEPDYKNPLAIIIGSEAEGASIWAHQCADDLITIPLLKSTESLNAAMAAGILLFEIVRQRH